MNISKLETLLQEDESIYLEFKESLDINSPRGKAKLLREVLSIANSPVRAGYLIMGVEDGTKRITGIEVTTKLANGQEIKIEEQVQQVMAEWCTPPIHFYFEVVEYKDKKLGVMQIYPGRPPYTLKKSTSFDDATDDSKKPKQIQLRPNQVFLRRGSIISEAEIDEILEMAQRDVTDLSDVTAEIGRMNNNLSEIGWAVKDIEFKPPEEEIDRSLEAALVGMFTGLALAYIWPGAETWAPVLAWPIGFFVIALFTAMKWTHFSIWRAGFVSFFMSTLVGLLFLAGSRYLVPAVFFELLPRFGFGLISGAISGIISSNLFEKFRITGQA